MGAQSGPARSYTRDDTDTRQGMTLGGHIIGVFTILIFGMIIKFKK